MNWLKLSFYSFTYIILIYFSKGIIINSIESVTNMFGYVQASNELNNIFSLGVELLTAGLVAILFFIPIGKNKTINLHYYIEHAYNSLAIYFSETEDPVIKKQRAASAMFNLLIYFSILVGYVWLISKIAGTSNGLMVILLLVLSYMLIQFVDFLTNIVRKIDELEKDVSNSGFLSKKNILTFAIIFFIFLFLGIGMPLTEFFYSHLRDFPIANLFDGNRINFN